jgi:hypothetical protein
VIVMASSVRSRELEALCTAVAHWRAHGGGGRGKRIPHALWEQAVAVARVDGVYKTGRATRLNCDRIKALMDAAERGLAEPEVANGVERQQFIALRMPGPTTRISVLAIELHNHHGERMRVENASAPEISAIMAAFLHRSS